MSTFKRTPFPITVSIRRSRIAVVCLLACSLCVATAQEVWLDELDASRIASGWGTTQANTSIYGKPLRIGGTNFDRGIGTHAVSTVLLDLEGKAARFAANVGVDDGAISQGTIRFYVIGDRTILWDSGPMKKGDAAKSVTVSLQGVRLLGLLVTDAGDGNSGDLADWCDASITFTEPVQANRIRILGDGVTTIPYILTPEPDKAPRINGPRVFSFRPGNPCLYKIPASGDPPLHYSADKLPAGVSIDPVSGLLTGTIRAKGVYPVSLVVRNNHGIARRDFRIVVSDNIAVTPPLGWSSWRWFGETISDQLVRNTADAFVESGLTSHGWTYISIDDSWQGNRSGATSAIQPNERFPDMRLLAESLHARGMKLGLSSSPWITTYNGYCGGSSDQQNGSWSQTEMGGLNFQREGRYTFEDADARQWAEWGIDYLKYEWYPVDIGAVERMRRALYKSGRDIMYHLTGPVSTDQAQDWSRLSNLWRSREEPTDTWSSIRRFIAEPANGAGHSGPGRWNDTGPLMVGIQRAGSVTRMTRLKPDEQYSQVSAWALRSSPMMLACDPVDLDDFTRSLLTNDEVLDIHQDPLGRPPRLAVEKSGAHVWVKELEDGAIAVGIFNTGFEPLHPEDYFLWNQTASTSLTVSLRELGLSKPSLVRDCWRQKNLGVAESEITIDVPHHGVVLLRVAEL